MASKVSVGDEVRVFDVNGHRRGQPDGGYVGTVVKVGRKLVEIKYGYCQAQFRIETGGVNDGYGHQYFLTINETEEQEIRRDALKRLEALGFTVSYKARNSYTADQYAQLANSSEIILGLPKGDGND